MDSAADARAHQRAHRGQREGRESFMSFVKKITIDHDFDGLSPEQLETYVTSENRNLTSLLAAFRLGRDEAYLREALEKFPHDPQVFLESARQSKDTARQLEILASLKIQDPGNGLVDFMSAKALFDMGRDEEALFDLLQSEGKPFNDSVHTSWQSNEEAYSFAGYSRAEAKFLSRMNLPRYELMKSFKVADKLLKLRQEYEAAGDSQSAEKVISAQFELARQIGEGPAVADQAASAVIGTMLWKGDDSPEAAEARAQIQRHHRDLMDRALKVDEMMLESSTVPESDWINYFDRAKLFGESAANAWILEKHPQP